MNPGRHNAGTRVIATWHSQLAFGIIEALSLSGERFIEVHGSVVRRDVLHGKFRVLMFRNLRGGGEDGVRTRCE